MRTSSTSRHGSGWIWRRWRRSWASRLQGGVTRWSGSHSTEYVPLCGRLSVPDEDVLLPLGKMRHGSQRAAPHQPPDLRALSRTLQVQYSINGETWADARPLNAPTNTIFEGNVDFISRKDNMFADGGVQARFIRVQPVHWVGPTAAMRVGLIMECMSKCSAGPLFRVVRPFFRGVRVRSSCCWACAWSKHRPSSSVRCHLDSTFSVLLSNYSTVQPQDARDHHTAIAPRRQRHAASGERGL